MSEYVQVPVRSLDYLENAIYNVNSKVEGVGSYIKKVDEEVKQLKHNFLIMLKEQRANAALQRAITEIIGVRQELEQNFGTHKQVRDNMLGILNATDSALVTERTISRISEELMLNAPNYWLAPCLVALSAWIARDKNLASRAITEAVRRDKEKTYLLFALICNRNGRTDVCYKWLQLYLQLQDPKRMKKSVMAFVDAYTSGVFGEDKDNVCAGTISEWMRQLKSDNLEFDAQQKEHWKDWFNKEGAKVMYRSAGYDELASFSPEFGKINALVSRITAYSNKGGLKDKINQVYYAILDPEELKREINNQLVKLVSNYEEGKEEELRDEEERLLLIKKLKGNEKEANARINAIREARREIPVDFAARLREAIKDDKITAAKKTAYVLLRDYIIDAYKEYITENKDNFPDIITLNIHDDKIRYDIQMPAGEGIKWQGVTKNGENLEEIKNNISRLYETAKEKTIQSVKPSGVKLFFAFVFGFIIGGVRLKKKFKQNKQKIEKAYNIQKQQMLSKVESAIAARRETSEIVSNFCGKEGWDEFEFSNGSVSENAEYGADINIAENGQEIQDSVSNLATALKNVSEIRN